MPTGTVRLNSFWTSAGGADVVGFRFNQPFQVGGSSKTLSDYDMVLFFPIADFVTDRTAVTAIDFQFVLSGHCLSASFLAETMSIKF